MDPLLIFRTWLESVSAAGVLAFLVRVTLVCVAGHVALRLLRRAPAAFRHLAATATLAALLLSPVLFAVLPAWPALRIPLAPTVAAAERASAMLVPRPWRVTGERTVTSRTPATPRRDGSSAQRVARTPLELVAAAARVAFVSGMAPVMMPLRAPGALVLLALAVSEMLLLLLAISWGCAAWLAHGAMRVERVDLIAEMASACGRLGLRRDVVLRVSDRVSVPVVVGIVKPCLLLPPDALDWPAARRQAVLVHELAHVARRDGFAQLIARLATAVYWFHPLAWTLARSARDECERAADDAVLRSGVRASDYAEHLLAVAREALRAPLPHAALAFARPSSLEARLVAILKSNARREPVSRRAVAWATVALAAFVLPLTSLRVVAAPRVEASTASSTTVTQEPAWTSFSQVTSQATQTRTSTQTSESAPIASNTEYKQPSASADSKSGESWYALGHEAYKDDRYQDSALAYENAARGGYRVDVAWYNAACSWSLAGRRDAALGALQHAFSTGFDDLDQVQTDSDLAAIRTDSRYAMMLELAMHTDKAAAQRARARTEYDALRAAGETDPQEWRSVGMTLLRSGDPERAVLAFQAEAALDSSSTALYNVACAQAVGRHTQAALKSLEQAVLMGFGDSHEIAKDEDLVSLHDEPGFDRILRLVDDLTLFSNGRGDDDTQAWRRDLPRFERVTRDYPNVGRAWFNLGYASLRVPLLDASERAFTRALDLGYRVGTTSYNLACVAARRGDVDGAFRWLERAEQAGMQVGWSVRTDSDLAAIRSDARYHALTGRWDAEHAESKKQKEKSNKDKKS